MWRTRRTEPGVGMPAPECRGQSRWFAGPPDAPKGARILFGLPCRIRLTIPPDRYRKLSWPALRPSTSRRTFDRAARLADMTMPSDRTAPFRDHTLAAHAIAGI